VINVLLPPTLIGVVRREFNPVHSPLGRATGPDFESIAVPRTEGDRTEFRVDPPVSFLTVAGGRKALRGYL
jgi:hypothetical protein